MVSFETLKLDKKSQGLKLSCIQLLTQCHPPQYLPQPSPPFPIQGQIHYQPCPTSPPPPAIHPPVLASPFPVQKIRFIIQIQSKFKFPIKYGPQYKWQKEAQHQQLQQ